MAETYCLYEATQSSPHTDPQIQIGDKFCVDCPEDGTCRGDAGQPGSIKIKDREGNEATFRAVLQNASCCDCPEGAHKGFSFAPKESSDGGWG